MGLLKTVVKSAIGQYDRAELLGMALSVFDHRRGRQSSPVRDTYTGVLEDATRLFSRPSDRKMLLERAGYRCESVGRVTGARCRQNLKHVEWHGAHLIAHSRGGATNAALNGAAFCARCNKRDGNSRLTGRQLSLIAQNRRMTRVRGSAF